MATPSKANILIIEGKRSDRPSFMGGLMKKGFQVQSVASGNAALAQVLQFSPHLVILDAASLRTSGKRICRSLRQHAPGVPIVVIQDAQADPLDPAEADVSLMLPFTLQKLLNRIKPFLPVVQKNVMQVGPFQLDPEQRWVRCNDKQALLTPRLVTLLRVLMEHCGEVIERETLFCQVWDTEYTGDTRTLDVHISWLRQALEEDPRHPHYIKTVRGLGYRLDVDDHKSEQNGQGA
ncbi:MAG TPA: response regulator transcription factor [Anaerolineaceae bacterium]|nr:response regulator transcription factor [Anaerolineaceae bacterium]